MREKSILERIELCHLRDDPGVYYYLYTPHHIAPCPQLMVTVHGISRNAREHVVALAPHMERLGWILLAPLFERGRFPDYQRLGRIGRGERADHTLDRMIAETNLRFDLDVPGFHLFGYSGGGQFAHRYAMAYPERITSLAVGAAGWYTFPDPEVAYPRGVRPSRKLPDVDFQVERFLHIPTLVVVGERDNLRDAELNTRPRIERQQGTSRLERGRNWIQALEDAARRYDLPPRCAFEILPKAGHSFRQCMKAGLGERLDEFLRPFSSPVPELMPVTDSLVPA